VALLADFVSSIRTLRRAPALTLALLLTIAIGIGSNGTVLGFIRGLAPRNLPLPGIESIVSIFGRDQDIFGPVSYEEVLSLEQHSSLFESVGAARESQSSVTIAGHQAVVSTAAVTPELARVLGLNAHDGIVVSDRLWNEEFGANTALSEARISVDAAERPIAGIAPDWLDGLYMGRAIDIWIPLRADALGKQERSSRTFWALGRLRDGISSSHAQTSLNADRAGDRPMAVQPYTAVTPEVTGGLSRLTRLLPLAAGAVFFIACANVAAFLLSRAYARSQETAVRVAIGASRRQLGRQLLSDSLVISAAGGAAGALLAIWTANIIPALLFEQDAAHLVSAPDPWVIVEVSAVCLAITAACGLVPLFELRDDDPVAVLRREGAGPSKGMRRVRSGLVVAQMACCCVLVITTGMLLEGFRTALRTTAGQRVGEPVLATVQARPGVLPAEGREYLRKVEAAAMSVSGVTSAAWVGSLPGSRPLWQTVRVEPPRLARHEVVIDVAAFTPQTVATIALPAVAGRMFGGRDTPQSCRVAIVNEAAAKTLFDGDAVGRIVEDAEGQRVEIVGVVAMRARASAPAPRPTIFYYAEQTKPPLDRAGPQPFQLSSPPQPVSTAVLDTTIVSPQYFPMMGLPTIEGRLTAEQSQSNCRVGVINQQAAELYFGGHAAGGAFIDAAGVRTEIIGVVRSALLGTSQRHPEPALYLPMGQDYQSRMTLILETKNANERLIGSVRQTLASVPGGAGLPAVLTLDAHLSRTALAPQRIATLLVSASAALGLVLGGLGVYSALADSARQRRREIALRIALGAQRWRVVRQVLIEGVRLAGAGTAAGALGALLAARGLTRISPGAADATAWVWLAAPVVLLTAVCLASVLPARRAMAVDPLTIMRDN
jgi:putative ABC transport system permease protein